MNKLLLWGLIWLFYVFLFSYNSENTNYVLIFSTVLAGITALTSYIIVSQVIPKFLSAKRYVWFGIYTFFTLLFTTFVILLFLMVSLASLKELRFEDLPPMSRNYVFPILLVYFVVALVSYISLWRKNTQTALKNTELQKQLLAAKFQAKEQELNYLKNQIHPHFLFNSLNTIYGLALKKSIETPDIILKLSSLLDYILYNANKPQVLLNDEIKHIENYIDLEKIRFSDTLKVTFTKELENPNFQLPPMLLLPFVENAFKHGSIVDGFLNISMHLSLSENMLHFSIKNSYKAKTSARGLGLKNIKERLEILFPNNYNLQLDSNTECFEVSLEINLLKQDVYA